MITVIQSTQNEQVKKWKKLLSAKGRKKEGLYLLEGWHLVLEAMQSQELLACILTEELYKKHAAEIHVPVYLVSQAIVKDLSETMTSQAVFGLVSLTSTVTNLKKGKYMLLDAIQDPGNLGTIVRTADALGFDGVILGEGCVDAYNGKTLRSMQGSHFHVPLIKMPLEQAIEELKALEVPVYGTQLDRQALSLKEVPAQEACALIVGNEGNGVSQAILDQCDQTIFIPMPGQAESLNVGVAAAILMYHFM